MGKVGWCPTLSPAFGEGREQLSARGKTLSPQKGLMVQLKAYPAFRAKRGRFMLGYPVSSRRAGLPRTRQSHA
jgi:hypothetical protein